MTPIKSSSRTTLNYHRNMPILCIWQKGKTNLFHNGLTLLPSLHEGLRLNAPHLCVIPRSEENETLQNTKTTHINWVSSGARLYSPLAWRALQSLNLHLPDLRKRDAWLRMTQSSRLLPYPSSKLLVLQVMPRDIRTVLRGSKGFPEQFDTLTCNGVELWWFGSSFHTPERVKKMSSWPFVTTEIITFGLQYFSTLQWQRKA